MRPWTLMRPAPSHRPTGMLLVYLPDAKGLLGKFEPACVLGIAQQRESPRTSCITFYHRDLLVEHAGRTSLLGDIMFTPTPLAPTPLTPLLAAGRAT